MPGFHRRPGVLVGLSYVVIGVAAWSASPGAPAGSLRSEAAGGSMVILWGAAALLAVLTSLAADRISAWLAPATVGPLALQPLTIFGTSDAAVLLAVLWPASLLPLALTIARGRATQRLVLGTAIAATVVGIVSAFGWRLDASNVSTMRYVLVASIVAIPAIAAGRHSLAVVSADRITERSQLAVTAVAPALAGLVLVTGWAIGVVALVVAAACVAIGSWVAVRPLTWVVARARAQRDLAVAITEAERGRLAADLHDGPLQDVLLLARRLDETGDREGAALARAIGGELRELSGDLRLPLLDDLGVGPALEWLAGRVRGMTAADVRVAHESDGRVPAPVELAAFRIAQEAIANAVRHGSPPVLVRCRTTPDSLSLSVEDAGQGLAKADSQAGSRSSRFGLLNMQQRAEQIGAHLEWRQPHAGGTLVALEWRAAP